eukprot:SAG31_NODE_928_length_10927_cov_4.616273_1_plen_103_part_00
MQAIDALVDRFPTVLLFRGEVDWANNPSSLLGSRVPVLYESASYDFSTLQRFVQDARLQPLPAFLPKTVLDSNSISGSSQARPLDDRTRDELVRAVQQCNRT